MGPDPLFSLGRKGEMTEGRKASGASKTNPAPLLDQGLDQPLISLIFL